uniref:Odorant receptor n=1 Tax=Sirex noctilio TaxID=36765 RepID=A0A857N3J6_9HYME|nr:odorant receptor 23 [Sirex noctilio]
METSMSAARDLEFAIEWNRIILRFLGIWPDQNSSKNGNRTMSFNFLFAVFFIFCFNVSQIIYLVMAWGQLDAVIEILAKSIAATAIALLKSISIWYNSKVLRSMLAHIAEDWMTPKSKREREVMLKNAKIARMLSIGGIFLIMVSLGLYIFIHVIVNLQPGTRNGTVSRRQLLYQAYFPFDTDKTPNYELTCIVQSVAAMYTATSYSGIDTFLAMLVLHLCAQFTNLQFTLKNLVTEHGTEIEFRKNLAIIVNKHERLNRFAVSMEKSFNMLLLVHMFLCTLQFCFIGYNFFLTFDNGGMGQLSFYQLLLLTIYVISGVMQLFVYCYVGEKLNVDSSQLGYAAYQCDWYKLSVPDARDLTFVMLRARTPLQITAGRFCSFSFSLFTDILKTSMGYLSMLLSVKNTNSLS